MITQARWETVMSENVAISQNLTGRICGCGQSRVRAQHGDQRLDYGLENTTSDPRGLGSRTDLIANQSLKTGPSRMLCGPCHILKWRPSHCISHLSRNGRPDSTRISCPPSCKSNSMRSGRPSFR